MLAGPLSTFHFPLSTISLLPVQVVLFLRLDHSVPQTFGIVAGHHQLDRGEERADEVLLLVVQVLPDALGHRDRRPLEFQHTQGDAVDLQSQVRPFVMHAGHGDFFGDGRVVVFRVFPVDQPDRLFLLTGLRPDLHAVPQQSIDFAIRVVQRLAAANQGSRKQDVYSLPRVIREIEEISHLVTREVFVCVDACDYEATFEDDQRSFHRHIAFDQLSNTPSDSRSPKDAIDPSIFGRMRQALKSSEDVRRYANKMLAHAADPRNRPANLGLTLSHFENAYRDLIWLTDYLCSTVLCSSGHEFLLHYLCDPLEDLDQPICSLDDLVKLRDYWTNRRDELENLERDAKGVVT